jgi:hypothetical protein
MIVDKTLEIKRDVVHGFQIDDDNIMDLWGPTIWVYRTHCNKYGKKEDDIRGWVSQGANNIFKLNGLFLTLNPQKVTCPVCQKNMSDDVKKISADAYEMLLDGYKDTITFFDTLHLDNFKRKLNIDLSFLFTCSGGSSIAWLEDFDFEKHRNNSEIIVKDLLEIKKEFNEHVERINNNLDILAEKYMKYLTEIQKIKK